MVVMLMTMVMTMMVLVLVLVLVAVTKTMTTTMTTMLYDNGQNCHIIQTLARKKFSVCCALSWNQSRTPLELAGKQFKKSRELDSNPSPI